MDAIDTNILARYLLDDDDVQSPQARQIVMQGAFISNSVILETAWLLQSRYDQSPKAVATALQALIDMPTIVVTNHLSLSWVMERYGKGTDFADMLHLVEAAGHDIFWTFDRKLQKQAGQNAPIHIKSMSD